MDALIISMERIKDSIAGAKVINTDSIVLDLETAKFLLGLCELNQRLISTTQVGATLLYKFSGGTVQVDIGDYVNDADINN